MEDYEVRGMLLAILAICIGLKLFVLGYRAGYRYGWEVGTMDRWPLTIADR